MQDKIYVPSSIQHPDEDDLLTRGLLSRLTTSQEIEVYKHMKESFGEDLCITFAYRLHKNNEIDKA